jgi:hypothetical protein
MLDALPNSDVLGEIMTYTRSVGQGRLFVVGESTHDWAALWLSEDGLQQLAAMGAQASLMVVPPSYDLTGPEEDADLTTEDTGAAKVLKSFDAGRQEGAVRAPKSRRGPDNLTVASEVASAAAALQGINCAISVAAAQNCGGGGAGGLCKRMR